jgi:glycosyltransferase involved in cell wall biosynthesis
VSAAPVILIDGHVARPPCTGVPWSVVELVQALAVKARGARFVLATDHPDLFTGLDGAPEWETIPCGVGDGALARVRWTLWTLPALARRLGADVLHVPTFPTPLRPPCPMAVTVNDVAFHLFPMTVETSRRWWYRLMLPRSLAAADIVLVNSRNTARELAAYHPAASDKIEVTPFGTPQWVLDRVPPPLRPSAAPFLFIGSIEPRKNLAGILSAFARFRSDAARENPDVDLPRLVIIGAAGWCNSDIHRQIEAGVQAGYVERIGHCDRDELWKRMTAARVLLFPSLHEGFGFPILEAMAARLPVITSDRGAMREVAGEAAILVDPDSTAQLSQAMLRLWRDDEHAGRLARAGLERCREWDWQATAERTFAAYHRLLVDR